MNYNRIIFDTINTSNNDNSYNDNMVIIEYIT